MVKEENDSEILHTTTRFKEEQFRGPSYKDSQIHISVSSEMYDDSRVDVNDDDEPIMTQTMHINGQEPSKEQAVLPKMKPQLDPLEK